MIEIDASSVIVSRRIAMETPVRPRVDVRADSRAGP